MLQTLEHRYQQHTLDRRQELVEALQYLVSPSAPLKGDTLLNEFRRLRLETDSLFLLELEKDALEKQRVHEHQLNVAAARHERIRRDAESVRNDFEMKLRMELERRREEEKRELDRIRQAKAEQELAERRRQVELARAQAAEELRRSELEKQRLEEEARIKAAEDTRKIAEEKARAQAEAEHQARIKDEEDRKATDLLTVSAAARGTSFTNVERENDNVEHMQDEYLRLHALLKGFRSWLVRHAKEKPGLKAKMGDMRREIRKTVGQLTAGKSANREPVCTYTTSAWMNPTRPC
jgi:nucleoporin GLE1